MLVAPERIPEILETYDKDPSEAMRQLDAIFALGQSQTPDIGPAAFNLALRSRGSEFFVAYLLRHGALFPAILDPSMLSMDDATAALKMAMLVETGCDVTELNSMIQSGMSTDALTRLIDLSARVRLSGRLRQPFERLRQHPNPFLQSKVELLLKRLEQSETALRQRLRDPDPRTQADAVEFFWGEDTAESREVFLRSATSPNDRVLGNGLYGLYLMGDSAPVRIAFDIAENQSPLVRPTAIWFMGQTGDPRFLPWLVEAMGTNDNRLRSRIFQAIRQIREKRAQAAAAGRLRVHIVSAAFAGTRERVIRFAVAGPNRPAIRGIIGTQVLVTEGQRLIQNISLKPLKAAGPSCVKLLCSGGASLPDDIASLAAPGDRLDVGSIAGKGWEREMEDFLAGPAEDLVLWSTGPEPPEIPDAPAWVERFRTARKRAHAVWPQSVGTRQSLPLDALARGTGGLAVRHGDDPGPALEQAVLAALHSYEIRYDAGTPDAGATKVQLQILNYHGAGEASAMLIRRRDDAARR